MAKKDPFYKDVKVHGATSSYHGSVDTGWGAHGGMGGGHGYSSRFAGYAPTGYGAGKTGRKKARSLAPPGGGGRRP
jgi:hypothetical protein